MCRSYAISGRIWRFQINFRPVEQVRVRFYTCLSSHGAQSQSRLAIGSLRCDEGHISWRLIAYSSCQTLILAWNIARNLDFLSFSSRLRPYYMVWRLLIASSTQFLKAIRRVVIVGSPCRIHCLLSLNLGLDGLSCPRKFIIYLQIIVACIC